MFFLNLSYWVLGMVLGPGSLQSPLQWHQLPSQKQKHDYQDGMTPCRVLGRALFEIIISRDTHVGLLPNDTPKER